MDRRGLAAMRVHPANSARQAGTKVLPGLVVMGLPDLVGVKVLPDREPMDPLADLMDHPGLEVMGHPQVRTTDSRDLVLATSDRRPDRQTARRPDRRTARRRAGVTAHNRVRDLRLIEVAEFKYARAGGDAHTAIARCSLTNAIQTRPSTSRPTIAIIPPR